MDSEQIHRQIKSELALKGLKLVDIANQLGISRQQVWDVSKGLAKTVYIREAIAEVIGKDPWTGTEH